MSQDILQQLSQQTSDTDALPPVEQWDPPHCGKLDLLIKANGEWLHEGSVITRKKLIKLFSRVIRKDDQEYVLVTPVEKVSIQVEWQPFVIIDFEKHCKNGVEYYLMIDNCDNQVRLSSTSQLKFSKFQGLELPVLQIRRNLFASFSRSCYYRLIEQAIPYEENGREAIKIASDGVTFNLGFVE
jgi:hypothetical protein